MKSLSCRADDCMHVVIFANNTRTELSVWNNPSVAPPNWTTVSLPSYTLNGNRHAAVHNDLVCAAYADRVTALVLLHLRSAFYTVNHAWHHVIGPGAEIWRQQRRVTMVPILPRRSNTGVCRKRKVGNSSTIPIVWAVVCPWLGHGTSGVHFVHGRGKMCHYFLNDMTSSTISLLMINKRTPAPHCKASMTCAIVCMTAPPTCSNLCASCRLQVNKDKTVLAWFAKCSRGQHGAYGDRRYSIINPPPVVITVCMYVSEISAFYSIKNSAWHNTSQDWRHPASISCGDSVRYVVQSAKSSSLSWSTRSSCRDWLWQLSSCW